MYYGKRKKNLVYYVYSGIFVFDINFIRLYIYIIVYIVYKLFVVILFIFFFDNDLFLGFFLIFGVVGMVR